MGSEGGSAEAQADSNPPEATAEAVAEEEDDDDAPETKHQRVDEVPEVGALVRKSVSWADWLDEEDREIGVERDYRRCDHCNAVFGSGNSLFEHLREVGIVAPEKSRGFFPSIERRPDESVDDCAEMRGIKKTQDLDAQHILFRNTIILKW